VGKPSAILNHPQATAIDQAILANHEPLKTLAVRFNVSVYSLSRRKKALAAMAMVETSKSDPDPDALEQQARMWRLRADLLWTAATGDQDCRGQVAAIAAGLRSCELMAQQAKVGAANPAPVPAGETPLTIEAMDAIISRAMGDRRTKLIDQLFAAPESTLAAVESILAESNQVN
jgi:hypothetical protein